MEKEYWDRFTSVHSPKTCAYVQTILGKKVSEDELVTAHQDSCKAKKISARRCGKSLFQFLTKFGYVNQDASSR